MGEAVEQCGSHLGIAKDGRPFAEAEVRGDHNAGALVELAQQMEEQCPARGAEGQIRSPIRSLVDRIEVRAGAKRGETEVTLVGRLAGILALGTNKNTRSDEATGGTFLLVAGVGFEPTTFRL